MFDDGNDENGPDPFVIDQVVSKANDRKLFMHSEFEQICAKYWQLLHSQPGANRTSDVITKDQYTQLMKRVYKVLLPLYREDEMSKEVSQEWIHDARGQPAMTLTMFQKTLFRIAHSWATHIDMDEYIELLTKVYERITVKKIIRGVTGETEIALPRIQVEIFQEKDEEDGAEWLSCLSDEYQDENYEYQHKEDPNNPGTTKRYKRPIPDGQNEDDGGVLMTVREPFLFKEEVQFFREPGKEKFDDAVKQPSEKDVVVDLLGELNDIYPIGYPAEQIICKMKNDIIQAFIKLKEDRRKAVAEMRRQMFEDGAKMKVERPPEIQRDPGLLDAQGFQHEEWYSMIDTKNKVKIPTLLRIIDKQYNQLRNLFKDAPEIVIRPFFQYPSKQVLKKTAPSKILGSHDPSTQINENLYNPALERRLIYKSMMCEMGDSPKSYCINVNYLLNDPVYDTAFRSDVNRIETSGNMSIKPPQEGEVVQDHEFCNVTTSFQKTMRIMLAYKFQTFWTNKLSDKQDPLDKQRDEKTFQQEQQRKTAALLKDSLTSKNLTENFDEKNYLKLMRGPFYNMISREGSREDDFVNCTTQDLIDSANSELLKILILGKPRSGKTTLAKSLAEKLDLVRISPDVWLDDLFFRIKDREENPPEEDEEEEEEAAAEEAAPEEENAEEGEEGQEAAEPKLDENGNPIVEEPVEEAPKEPEVPKRDKKDLWLTDLEYEVRNDLRAGKALTLDQIDEIVKEMVNSPMAQTKGFIIDLTFAKNGQELQWGTRLLDNDILVESNEITHIIELAADDEEVKKRAASLLITPQNGVAYSKYERAVRNKPKPVVLDEDGNPMEEEEEPEENEEELIAMGLKGPLIEAELVQRMCDSMAPFNKEVEYYNMRERNIFDEYIVKLFDSTYIKVDIAGLTPEELTDAVMIRMKPNEAEPLRPIAHIIEDGAGSFKELLTAGLDDQEGFFLPRQWSLWKTMDPVSLRRGQVEQGLPEFAAHFGNNVFVFQNEENLKEFVKQPRFYISQAPEMPPNFRLMMMGPRGVGVKTQAQKLEQLYGWRVVDFKKIVQQKLRDILAMPVKPPNNITNEGPCMICLNESELNDIKEGKPIPSWKFLPWIMEFLEIPLRVKDPPPPEEDSATDEEWEEARLKQHRDKIKKKKKEAEAAAKAAQEAANAKAERATKRKEALEQGLNLEELGLQESEEEIIIEDVSIDQLCLLAQEDGSLPPVDRFILIGFPQTETHCSKLKEFNIDFDRVLFLSEDENEEEAGQQTTKRMTELEETAYDWAAEVEIATALQNVIKEHLGEDGQDKIMELKDCTGTIEEVHFKIRSKLDPFFTRPDDNTEDIRTSADYEEEEIYRMPRSDFGDFCPVTYVDEGFLVKGGSDEDGGEPNELYVNGKRYFFAGVKEMEKFRKEPSKYMIVQSQGAQLPIQPPAPKFMITGNKCAGITTQINLLCEKFKLEPLELMDCFNKRQAEQLKARQRKRLLDRGFKGIPAPENEDDEPEVDTEIIEDPEDFDKAEQDVKDLSDVIDAKKGLIIDGNWRPAGEDAEYAIPDLLKNARRMPEIVIVLKCKEEISIKRNLADCEEELKAEFERKMEEREQNRIKAREEAKKEKLQELEEGDYEEMSPAEIEAKKKEEMEAWEEARDEQEREEDENDDEKPDLEKMKEDKAEAIKAICEADEANLETLKTKLVEEWKAVEVLELDTSKISAEFVHIKLLDMLKNHIKFRKDIVERAQAIKVKPEEVPVYEASYTYKQSKFGIHSPISPYNPRKTKNFTVLYRERLYHLSDADEQEEFLLEPSKYVLGVEAVPLDIKIMPRVVVQGLPKSGKTELSKRIASTTGAVHLQMEELIEGFVDKDSSFADKVADKLKRQGRDLDDLMLVQLIQKRVEMKDCASRGWILEGFPHTRAQAILMAKKSLLPTNVIMLNIPIETVYKRTEPLQNEEFGCDRIILKRRLDYAARNLPNMVYFFQKFYNNVTSIDGLKSKWFMENVAVGAVTDHLKAKMIFAKDYQHQGSLLERPCRIQNLNMDRVFFKQSISQYGYHCPVSWKTSKQFVSCTHLPELSVLYKNLFYYFASETQRELFIRNPKKFTENVIFSTERNIPQRMQSHKASEIADTEKALLNYCPVTLADEEKLVPGNPILVISFKGEKFIFCNEEKLQKFLLTPARYAKTKLPVKIPPEQKPVHLYNLQKEENSITFLEQALGSVVTKGLREIGEQRLKYPTLTVKETMLKLFAIFLKTENPANTEHMRQKYMKKMQTFLEKCTVPEELNELAEEKDKKNKKGKWPQFKENYYNTLGQQYDKILVDVEKEKAEGFWGYMK